MNNFRFEFGNSIYGNHNNNEKCFLNSLARKSFAPALSVYECVVFQMGNDAFEQWLFWLNMNANEIGSVIRICIEQMLKM